MKREENVNRREFLKAGVIGAAGLAVGSRMGSVLRANPRDPVGAASGNGSGELLYNGIRLPSEWPPRNLNPRSRRVVSVPYLKNVPDVIPVKVGRQLFVDDFLIERTNLRRTFHQPVPHAGNPVLRPQTPLEMNNNLCPVACPFTDGAFYDSRDGKFKMWYMAGWFDGTAYAESRDGVHWTRPNLPIVPGTNRLLPDAFDQRRDGATVWLDDDAENPRERFKMFLFTRAGKMGRALQNVGGWIFTSGDGIHWDCRGRTSFTNDNTLFFYNPFRKKWVFSLRTFDRRDGIRERTRGYWESSNFLDAVSRDDTWAGQAPVFWTSADEKDLDRPDYPIGERTQLYKVDAVGYESLMLGLFQIHYGPSNAACAEGGFPKLTDLQLGFSRDGFHWDRPHREAFIGGTLEKEDWDRAYIHSVGGGCFVVGDKLYFYYSGFRGDENNLHPEHGWNGMYANGSTGIAVLRRDGFASMDAGSQGGELITRPLVFEGEHLFVNAAVSRGDLRVEVLDRDGNVIAPFDRGNCVPVSTDSTLEEVRWNGGGSLGELAGQAVRFRFLLNNGELYSFWVSKDRSGASQGFVAAGGPGLRGHRDTVGKAGYAAAAESLGAIRLG